MEDHKRDWIEAQKWVSTFKAQLHSWSPQEQKSNTMLIILQEKELVVLKAYLNVWDAWSKNIVDDNTLEFIHYHKGFVNEEDVLPEEFENITKNITTSAKKFFKWVCSHAQKLQSASFLVPDNLRIVHTLNLSCQNQYHLLE